MPATLILVQLAGYVVVLLWGMHMVHSGIVRAYGSALRRVMGTLLPNRISALAAGTLVTMLLQSSTATALMATSFAGEGFVALVPALAVMLGANVGTALVVKALSFDVAALFPLLLIVGYAAFRRILKGRLHDLGRVGIGLGLMLLALRLMVVAIAPAQAAPILGELLAALTREPLLAILLAALLTWMAHSSVATILLVASLSSASVITPVGALALVLGANIGSAIPPVLAVRGGDPATRRLPVGNLLFRLVGCAAAFPLLRPVAEFLWQSGLPPAAAVADFHLGLNLALAFGLVGLLGPASRMLTRLLPDHPPAADPGQPLYLDEAALDTPYLALANGSREVLRLADLVAAMLDRAMAGLRARDRGALAEVERAGKAAGRLRDAAKSYLARLCAEPMAEPDSRSAGMMLEFAINLGHAGGIIERNLAATAARKIKQGVSGAGQDERDIEAMHGRVAQALRLAVSTFLSGDPRLARELLDAKRRINEAERAATRAHLGRLDPSRPDMLQASSVYLAVLRDLRRVNSHLAAIGYDVLGLGADEGLSPDADAPSGTEPPPAADPLSAAEWDQPKTKPATIR